MQMYKPSDVDDYIRHHESWQEELQILRELIIQSELEEQIKWFIPTYTMNNKNVLGLAAFKDWVTIWFFHGSFLLDPLQVLVSGNDDTKGQRQWRFKKSEKIDKVSVMEYIVEAVENQRKGLVTKINKPAKQLLKIHPFLEAGLQASKEAMTQWKSFSVAKKNEYIKYINEAKQDTTKERRVKKSISIIEHGQGLNDRYK